MCNACGFFCCGCDFFEQCGCDCPEWRCWDWEAFDDYDDADDYADEDSI